MAHWHIGTLANYSLFLKQESVPFAISPYQSYQCDTKIEHKSELLRLDVEYDSLKEMVALNNQSDTRILDITVTADDPYMAKEIVDEVSQVSVSRIASIMNVDEPTTVEYGHLENSPSSPNAKKNIAIGGLLGLVASAAVIIILYLLNDTICSEDDVQKYLGLNTLGLIPIEEGAMEQMMKDKRKRKGHSGGLWNRLLLGNRSRKGNG